MKTDCGRVTSKPEIILKLALMGPCRDVRFPTLLIVLVKTTRIPRINNFCGNFDLLESSKILGNDRVAPASLRLGGQCFQVPRGSHPRKPRSAAATVSSARQSTSPAAVGHAKAVLAYMEKTLGRVAEASASGHAENGG